MQLMMKFKVSKMKAQFVFVFLVFLLKHKVTFASMCDTQRYSEVNVYLQGFTLESSKVDDIFECYKKCDENINCASANMSLMDKTCELKYSTKTRHPERNVSRLNTIYMEIRDENAAPGARPDIPIASCKKLKEDDSQAKSGVYWMKFNEPSSAPFQVFCDMTTDGGGWTLVYSYTFTQFNQFSLKSNAITPIPNWHVDRSSGTWVPQSTTAPLSESARSAMDFALWKKIGHEVLLKPNITNWVACKEGNGSLVNWVTGSVTCRVVKAITPTCTAVVPNIIQIIQSCGPALFVDDEYMIDFDGITDRCAPVHDPCGGGSYLTHLTSISNPGAAICSV